jgi:prepilin-type N-terminal cleavage/methylation domain-containing protein/prepilin-type processing-associated H-X9-DG protein
MKSRRGVTLLELIVTVAIILLLATLSGALLSGVGSRARLVECRNNMRQVWVALSGYAEENYALLPPGSTTPTQLPSPTARTLADRLGGRIEHLYCRTYPQRSERLKAWQKARSDGQSQHQPYIGYLYLAGSRFENWDVPNEQLPEGFGNDVRIKEVGQGLAYSGDVVWLADVAWCTTPERGGRLKPYNWKLMNHPPQRVVSDEEKWARLDYRLPEGANVLFEDGHVLFRPLSRLRPRLMKSQGVYYW